MFKLNTDIGILTHSQIIEWDISSGNISMMKEYKLTSNKIIEKLSGMKKEERNIKVGLLQRKDQDFAEALEKSFDDAVNSFIEINEIPSNNIIAIKRDAVFIYNYDIKTSNISENIRFIPKNRYRHYTYLKPYEIYMKTSKDIDVKGLSDTLIPLHLNGVLKYIYDICELYTENDRIEYFKEYFKVYNMMELPFDNYREFNQSSVFNCIIDSHLVQLDNIDENLLNDTSAYIDTSFNRDIILIPFLRYFIK